MKSAWKICLMAAFMVTGITFGGVIVPGLDDSTAMADYSVAYTGGEWEFGTEDITGQITLAARFNPDISQMTGGSYIVLEVGGTTFGTGLYLGDGQLFFVSKAGNSQVVPTSMNDTDFADKFLAVTLGTVNFGAENEVYVSMDINAGVLTSSINGVLTTYTIANSANANPDGNQSITFLGTGTPNPGWMGGLTEQGGTEFSLLFWNNAQNLTQTAGYDNQRGQIFEAYVPEPTTLCLLGLGVVALRRRQ